MSNPAEAFKEALRAQRVASVNFNPDTVEKIADLTDRNNHGEAIALGAKMLGHSHIEKCMKLVIQLHKLEGSMPKPLMDYRHLLYTELMRHAKSTLSPDEYDQFYKAF